MDMAVIIAFLKVCEGPIVWPSIAFFETVGLFESVAAVNAESFTKHGGDERPKRWKTDADDAHATFGRRPDQGVTNTPLKLLVGSSGYSVRCKQILTGKIWIVDLKDCREKADDCDDARTVG